MKSKKYDFAFTYLLTHPDALRRTGRALEIVPTPYGKIAYRTWNDAKRDALAADCDRVTLDFIAQTVTDPAGVITSLLKFRALTPARIIAFYRAAGYTVADSSEKRVVLLKLNTLEQERAA